MSTSRLLLYNDALTICGERHISSLTENREPRRLLDHVWDNDGVKSCLERGQWKFAMRAILFDYDPSITPEFGYKRAFLKPSDWVLTSAVCEDEFFLTPALRYSDENGYWYAELDKLYIKYVSDGGSYGGDLSKWTANFQDFVAAYFASKIIMKLTSDEGKVNTVVKWMDMKLRTAKNTDAMADPTTFPAPGSFVNARSGRSNRDFGSRHTLIG